MMGELIVVGGGGHGRVAAEAAELAGWTSVVFLDDVFPSRTDVGGKWPVVGKLWKFYDYPEAAFLVAFGDGSARRAVYERLIAAERNLVSVIHPSAIVSRYADVGAGVLVCAGAIVNIGTIVGNGVIINTGSTVDHDCKIGSFSHICPGANLAGGVSVGEGAWVGIGASVKQDVSIGDGAVIGAGAAVVDDVPASVTVVGVPARPL